MKWRNADGVDCKGIGPASQCFCGHRYKEHNFDNIETRIINCKSKGCKCKMFDYIPIFGSQDLKCLCKHSCQDHNPNGKRECLKCKTCSGFTSKHHCNCEQTFDMHQTVFESRQEREAQGRPVDPSFMQENLTGGMGGLSDF